MAQQAANLSSQLHTGKVPIPRFKSGKITPSEWIEAELQFKAALTSQQCKEAWNTTPCVADDTAEDAAANTRGDANKKKIEQCNAAIALLTASFSQNKSLTARGQRAESVTTPAEHRTESQKINSPGPGVSTELHSVNDSPSMKTLTSFWGHDGGRDRNRHAL